jgi:hypothetical protein
MNFFNIRKKQNHDKLKGYEKGISEKNIEIDIIRKQHKKEIDRQISIHKGEIENIRGQVKNEYEPRLKEKIEEINRLNKIIIDKRNLYDDIKKSENEARYKIQEISDLFLAAFYDFSRASQKVELARIIIKKFGIIEPKKIEKLEDN